MKEEDTTSKLARGAITYYQNQMRERAIPTEHPNLIFTAKDRLQLRINALTPPVRNYLALSEALTFELDEQTKTDLHEMRLLTFDSFTPEHTKELGLFLEFRDSLKPKK